VKGENDIRAMKKKTKKRSERKSKRNVGGLIFLGSIAPSQRRECMKKGFYSLDRDKLGEEETLARRNLSTGSLGGSEENRVKESLSGTACEKVW